MKEVTIICPIYNEEQNIQLFVDNFESIFQEHKDLNFSILFADNASTDNSNQILKSLCEKNKTIKYIRYAKNYGVMKSIYTAIHQINTDGCCVFDCDLQDDPKLLSNFISHWKNGYKVVFGKRVKRKESFILSIFRIFFKKISYFFRGYNIGPESGTWFFDKTAVEEIKKSEFDPFLPALIERLYFEKKTVPYERIERKLGLSQFNFFNYLSYALDGLVSGTIKPLRLSIYFSFLFAFISLCSAFYFIVAKFYLNIFFAEGIAAMIIINLVSFSLIFLFFGILGEYIGKLYQKKENKELAIILSKINI
jgi:polyisoprenyl-phosphate glycosyltransferase